MRDPLNNTDSYEHQLFEKATALMNGVPLEAARSIAVNLLVNAIRQSVPYRKDAETIIDELFGRAKTLLLDQHYDPVTGRRRTVFPFTQVLEMPFFIDEDVIPTTEQ